MYKEIDKNMWAVWLVGKGTVENMAIHEYSKNDVTQEFFAKLAARGYDPLWHSITGIVECDIENVPRWPSVWSRTRLISNDVLMKIFGFLIASFSRWRSMVMDEKLTRSPQTLGIYSGAALSTTRRSMYV